MTTPAIQRLREYYAALEWKNKVIEMQEDLGRQQYEVIIKPVIDKCFDFIFHEMYQTHGNGD
jgi:hypothetical protein